MTAIIKKILFLTAAVAITGCSMTSGNTRNDPALNNQNQPRNNNVIDGKVRPFVDKNIRDEEINIGIPIYKF